MVPRVGDVMFLDHGGWLGPRVGDGHIFGSMEVGWIGFSRWFHGFSLFLVGFNSFSSWFHGF